MFGVGITVMTMMSRDRQPGVNDRWQAALAGSTAAEDYPLLSDASASDYSDTLKELVAWCVNFHPQARPSFQDLRDAINACTQGDGGSPEDDIADGMRQSTDVQLFHIGLKAERWAIGMDMDELDVQGRAYEESDDDDEQSNNDQESDQNQEPDADKEPGNDEGPGDGEGPGDDERPAHDEGPKAGEKPKAWKGRVIDEDYDFEADSDPGRWSYG